MKVPSSKLVAMGGIAIIGLDGVGYENLLLMKKYNLKLGNLVNDFKGRYYIASYPPITPIIWTSELSGTTYKEHGIYGFFNYKANRPFISADIRVARLHEMTAFNGENYIIINVPITYPIKYNIRTRDSIIVTDWLSPSIEIYPNYIDKKIVNGLNYSGSIHKLFYRVNNKHKLVKLLTTIMRRRLESLEKLVSNHSANLLIYIISETDWIGHLAPETIYNPNEASDFYNIIYEIIRIVRKYYSKTIILSDHGFWSLKRRVELGYIINNYIKNEIITLTKSILSAINLLNYKMSFLLNDLPLYFISLLTNLLHRKNKISYNDRIELKQNYEKNILSSLVELPVSCSIDVILPESYVKKLVKILNIYLNNFGFKVDYEQIDITKEGKRIYRILFLACKQSILNHVRISYSRYHLHDYTLVRIVHSTAYTHSAYGIMLTEKENNPKIISPHNVLKNIIKDTNLADDNVYNNFDKFIKRLSLKRKIIIKFKNGIVST